jgi:hypothetical protein
MKEKTMTTTYTVEWTIEVEADSPREAAQRALDIQRDPLSNTTFFSTHNWDTDEETDVDLDTPEAD